MRQDGSAEFISASLSLPRYHGEGGPRKRWKGHKEGAVARSLRLRATAPLYMSVWCDWRESNARPSA